MTITRKVDFLEALLAPLLQSVNEILTTGTVIIALSLLLYNLSRNLNNRVTRAASVALGCVTFAYMCDAFISLDPDPNAHAIALRLQWFGIAFIPAALFHLSDALLATTGLPSRGRRRRVVRILYLISAAFLVAAAQTDILIRTVRTANDVIVQAEWFFGVYVAYFVIANIAMVINVNRARQRALARSTSRRLAYLQAAILTPAFGIFPYSALIMTTDEMSLNLLLLVNIANLIVIMMLIFLSYPLSFFGSDVPDRVVKVELLRFLLRGPGTGLLALAMIVITNQATRILGLSGDDFMPVAVVGVVLIWQWSIALAMPWLEKMLVNSDDEDEQLARLQDLSDRILTHSDLLQLIQANLEACRDYLRVGGVFIITNTADHLELISAIGNVDLDSDVLHTASNTLAEALTDPETSEETQRPATAMPIFYEWQGTLVTPLYSKRSNNGGTPHINGVFGLVAPADYLSKLDEEEQTLLTRYVQRAEQTLDDMLLQGEIVAALEGLLPQISITRTRAGELEFKPGRQHTALPKPWREPARDEIYEQVRAALKHYWGGPGITRSRLMDLRVVQDELDKADSPVQALRHVLQRAIERQRPPGQRSMTGVEWTLYNILDLRFIEGKKVREVTQRMSMSDADFYRKQRLAIETVVDTILAMEQETRQTHPSL